MTEGGEKTKLKIKIENNKSKDLLVPRLITPVMPIAALNSLMLVAANFILSIVPCNG